MHPNTPLFSRLAVLALVLVLPGCQSGGPDAPRPARAGAGIVGDWTSSAIEQTSDAPDPLPVELVAAMRIDFTFRPDGTFESRSFLSQGGTEIASEVVAGSWELSGSDLVTRADGRLERRPYTLEGDRLTLDDREDGLRIVLRRR